MNYYGGIYPLCQTPTIYVRLSVAVPFGAKGAVANADPISLPYFESMNNDSHIEQLVNNIN
jgi:hypothetical protein